MSECEAQHEMGESLVGESATAEETRPIPSYRRYVPQSEILCNMWFNFERIRGYPHHARFQT